MGIKKVRLNYEPIAVRRTHEVAYKISRDHVNAVNHSIETRIYRNAIERQESEKSAKDFVVKEKGPVLKLKSRY